MGDRRPSLIDQMALAAALQQNIEFDGADSESSEDSEESSAEGLLNDSLHDLEEVEETSSNQDLYDDIADDESGSHGKLPLTFGEIEDPSHGSEGLDGFNEGVFTDARWTSDDNESNGLNGRTNAAPFKADGSYASEDGQSALLGQGLNGPVRRGSHSIRRPSINITVAGGTSAFADEEEILPLSDGMPATSNLNSMLSRISNFSGNRRPTSSVPVLRSPMDNAIESLATHNTNNEWENIAAAATVVAASSRANTTSASQHIKFAVGDTVLVLLALLNVTNVEDPKDTFTVAPVNRKGFPQGEGRIDEEKVGPYRFVLATVNHVHFDEDDRYYTVVREDTGTEQRADSGWIEQLNDPAGIEAAARAAKLTVRSAQDKPTEILEEAGFLQDTRDFLLDITSWPADFSRSVLLPSYRRQRANAKHMVTQFLYGDSPFACKVRITGINFIVFCSVTFLFLEVVNLAFFSAIYDKEFSIIGVTIWCILVLELLFEVIVRPKGYAEIVKSDRAFAPSTARYLNRFHLFFETCALLTYIPEFQCLGHEVCTRDSIFSRVTSSLDAVIGRSEAEAARGRFVLGLTALRLFGPIRHWKQMFITNASRPTKRVGIEKWLIAQEKDIGDSMYSAKKRASSKKNDEYNDTKIWQAGDDYFKSLPSSEEDQRLKNAGTIGTALMVVNSQRALVLLAAIILVLPLFQSLSRKNITSYEMVDLLQAHNMAAPTNSSDDCEYLEYGIQSWLQMAAVPQPASLLDKSEDAYILYAQLLPVRCDFQEQNGVITYCEGQENKLSSEGPADNVCSIWDEHSAINPADVSRQYFAKALNLRLEGLRLLDRTSILNNGASYNVSVVYNDNPTIAMVNMGDFFVLVGILLVGLYGLNALRGEAIRLVLDPLQRMLKIVLRYAENPLSQDVKSSGKDDDSVLDVDAEEIGNYETEQLINAITKIADLLRKCWGVAGAGIISSNLARTKDGKTVVFNPTVPGKRVYALFGFVAINGFSEQLRALDRDVMILINDVAKVVHDEVFRWALGDHGQCNKNLGSAFLMVFRIGDFSEVHKKKQVATEKLFRENTKNSAKKSANLRRRNNSRSMYTGRKSSRQDMDEHLQLASLPGIQAFTDRALLGMLKSFAGVHRDKQMTVWKNDFRLSAGVSAYHADIIYGMDAGWAVEGAVGSEYKIDATYLSPHVNMASRMMSAAKQYDVTILLSKAVEELLSRTCRKKLRHLDTIFVKGSKVKQEIFTYDARYHGVDFFLLERTPDQADLDAESYAPTIWDRDPDVLAMRQHITDEFMEEFHLGVKQYLAGKWKDAHKTLEHADELMVETVLTDGYLEYDMEELEGRILDRNDQSEEAVRIRHKIGDGACRVLMTFMERRNLIPPDNWDGVRQLSSK